MPAAQCAQIKVDDVIRQQQDVPDERYGRHQGARSVPQRIVRIPKLFGFRYDVLLDLFVEGGRRRICQHFETVAIHGFLLRKNEAVIIAEVVSRREPVVHLRIAQFEQAWFGQDMIILGGDPQPDRIAGADTRFCTYGFGIDIVSVPDQIRYLKTVCRFYPVFAFVLQEGIRRVRLFSSITGIISFRAESKLKRRETGSYVSCVVKNGRLRSVFLLHV